MEKLYVIVRSDLAPGAQLAQSVHAAAEFAVAYAKPFTEWARAARNIVCLSVPNAATLHDLLLLALAKDVPGVGFEEPDLEGELTAIALGAGAEKLVSSLPLALKPQRKAA